MAKQQSLDQLYQHLADATGETVEQIHEQIGKFKGDLAQIGQSKSERDILNEAIKSAGAMPSQTQLREGAQKYGGYSSEDWAALSPEDKAKAIQAYTSDPNTPYFSPGTQKMVQGEVKHPQADPSSGGVSNPQLQALAKWLTGNYVEQGALAMGQQGQELAQQNKSMTNVVDQYIQMAGAQSGSPAVAAAMGAYANAYSAGEGLQSAAYANMGAANAQYLQESPLYPVANLLTQGFGSTQYKELPASTVQGLPANVQAALAAAGVTESTSAGGSGTPIVVPKGASGSSSMNIAQILGLQNPATNPNINPNLSAGNPNVPSGQ